jgi:aryl-alcohol dehydrogenase-like predicted oxidoreductase
MSEKLSGRVLKPHRDQVFLATKVRTSDADGVRASVDESLERLQTDRIDLLQYHGEWITDETVQDIEKPNGVLAGLKKDQEEGLVRYIGFHIGRRYGRRKQADCIRGVRCDADTVQSILPASV